MPARNSCRPLRIGIITDGLLERRVDGQVEIANGGVGVYIYNLVTHLRAVAPQHRYVLMRHGAGDLDIYHDHPDDVVLLPAGLSARLARGFEVSHRRLADELRLDLLHYPNQFGGAFLAAAIPRVMTLHDITPLLFPRYHPWSRVVAYRLLLRRSLRAADHVIVDAAHTGADLRARGLVRDDRVTIIPLAPAARFRPTEPRRDFTTRYDLPERFIFTVGVLEPRKNHALLLEVLRHLHAQGERIGLVIVGRDGWRWRNPLADATAAPLRPWVRLFRNVPDADLVELYNRAAAFAYPSLYEGYGLPVVEAMACGTPVVASTASSLPEVAGAAALFADPTDANDFAAKLLQVLRDPGLRARLVAAGRQQVRSLSWERTAAQTLDVYERVCRDRCGAIDSGSPL